MLQTSILTRLALQAKGIQKYLELLRLQPEPLDPVHNSEFLLQGKPLLHCLLLTSCGLYQDQRYASKQIATLSGSVKG